jgi:hypothetical protein
VTAEAQTPPYNRQVQLHTYVAGAAGAGGADINSQIEQIQQMIASGYDAIITFPISPAALNPVTKQACERGVVVIAYDGAVTEPCAYNVHINQFAAGKFTAQWLATALHGKGNIVEANGVPGTSVDTLRRAGAASIWKQHSGIHVIAQFPGTGTRPTRSRAWPACSGPITTFRAYGDRLDSGSFRPTGRWAANWCRPPENPRTDTARQWPVIR